MNRVAFLVDGFNLYHSLREASERLGQLGAGTRWLDLTAFCRSYLHAVGHGAALSSVHYFSAVADHLDATRPESTLRHRRYLECLQDRGVEIHLAHFKSRWDTCQHCYRRTLRHEEKETDVAIGVLLLELMLRDDCDSVVLLSGDSDLAPALRAAARLAPDKRVHCCFPFMRHSVELRSLAHHSFKVSRERYGRFQLPDPVVLGDGRRIAKPAEW